MGAGSEPRNELADNELEVSNSGLVSLGFKPITLSDGLLEDVKLIAEASRNRFLKRNIK